MSSKPLEDLLAELFNLPEAIPYKGVVGVIDANVKAVLRKCSPPYTLEKLRNAFEAVKSEMSLDSTYLYTMSSARSKYPRYFPSDGNENMICYHGHGEAVTPELLDALMANPHVVTTLTKNAATVAREEEADDRKSLIAMIAMDRPTFPIYSSLHGCVRWVDSKSLEQESTDRLREILESVENTRAAMSANRDEQKTALKTIAAIAKGEADDIFLEDPQTPGQEYTAKRLKQLSREQYRAILFTPDGQSRGKAVTNAITRILRSGR